MLAKFMEKNRSLLGGWPQGMARRGWLGPHRGAGRGLLYHAGEQPSQRGTNKEEVRDKDLPPSPPLFTIVVFLRAAVHSGGSQVLIHISCLVCCWWAPCCWLALGIPGCVTEEHARMLPPAVRPPFRVRSLTESPLPSGYHLAT